MEYELRRSKHTQVWLYDSGDAIISQTWADKGGGSLGRGDPGVVGLPFVEKEELNDDCR